MATFTPDSDDAIQAGLHPAELTMAPFVAGAGPEQMQLRTSRDRTTATMASSPVAGSLHGQGRGRRLAPIDVRSPQVFVSHPVIRDAVATSNVGAELAWPRVPGRAPVTGWDGEPGAAQPFGDW